MPRLYVHGPYEFTELRVLDPGLRVVASGVKSVEGELPAGIYRVQARVPGAFGERLVPVGLHGDTVGTSITDFPLDLDSPAPVVGVKTYSGLHADVAKSESHAVHVTFSEQQESQLFIFIRSDGSERPGLPPLSVETNEGDVIARLDRDGRGDPDMGYGALSIALPAGTYFLAHYAPGLGRRAQAVFVEDGWQTQVFIPWDPDAIDPSRALVSMLPIGFGFDPYRPELYQPVEAALDGLARGQMILSPIDEEAFLDARLGDPGYGLISPVYGLIGAYSYLLRGDVDPVRVMAIASALLKFLPHSPDAHLLYRMARQAGGEDVSGFEPPIPVWAEFDVPPMFAVGTDRLLDQAAEDTSPVRATGWLARVAAARTSGSVWTRWDVGQGVGPRTTELLKGVTRDRPVPTDVAEWARRGGLRQSAVEQSC